MLESWSIARRISAGFLVVTLVVIGLAVFSNLSVRQLGGGYLEYRQTARQTIAINAYVEDLFEARVAALKFRSQPTLENRQEVVSNIQEILQGTSYLAAFEVNPGRLATVQELLTSVEEYQQAFERSADFNDTAVAFKKDLLIQLRAIESAVNDLFLASIETGNQTLITNTGVVLGDFMRSSVGIKQYFLTTNMEDLERAQTQFAEFKEKIGALLAQNPVGQVAGTLSTVENLTIGFEDNLQAFGDANQSAKSIQTNTLDRIGPQVQERFDVIASDIVDRQNQLGPQGSAIVQNLQMVIPATGVVATLIAILSAFVIGRWISGSVQRLADTTSKLAEGDNEIEIAGADHAHELGQVARALVVFRDAQIDRERAEAERLSMQKSQEKVVNVMQSELSHLADGNLTIQISEQFDPEYEELRSNFNRTVSALQAVIAKVAEASLIIRSTTVETNTATNELSQRTENQAATLEETAAALDELTASVRSAAEHAKSVDSSVHKARSEAERNGTVVAQAVSAMGEIAESSKQITQVITVIEDIAFQTNLLALNAGVEAARAGESGRGFAVVASEVRALAQRSAEAAKEISELIANSSKHVKQGTQLVGDAGTALSEIITQVNEIASMTSQIASSSAEQSIGLSEINIGVNQLDQVTQQNAAMVQESMSRGEGLAHETEKLNGLIAKFTIAEGAHELSTDYAPQDALSTAITQTHTPAPRPEPKKVAVGGAQDAMWEDF